MYVPMINVHCSHIKTYSIQTIFCFWRAQFCFDPNSMSLCGWKIYGDNCDLFLSSRDFKCKERNWEFTKVHEGGGAIYISDFSTGSKQFQDKNLLKMYSCRFSSFKSVDSICKMSCKNTWFFGSFSLASNFFLNH